MAKKIKLSHEGNMEQTELIRLEDVQILAPRGKFNIIFLQKCIKIVGKSFDFILMLDNIDMMACLPLNEKNLVNFVVFMLFWKIKVWYLFILIKRSDSNHPSSTGNLSMNLFAWFSRKAIICHWLCPWAMLNWAKNMEDNWPISQRPKLTLQLSLNCLKDF